MTDHIKRSLEIQAFLDKEKIKVEPDEFAPKVYERFAKPGSFYVAYHAGRIGKSVDKYVCPYYGPGGEGNLLKALRGFWRRGGELIIKGPPCTAMMDFGEGGRLCFGGKRSETTDGIALADLLYKIATGGKK